jgi:hypothetical protein
MEKRLMRTFAQALPDHELVVLRVMGEWWELDLTGDDKATCVAKLAEHLAGLAVQEELAFLPPEELAAIEYLMNQHGRAPVATFARQFGDVRQMGPAALAREEPWYDPANAAEALWYRGFLFRGFDETPDGTVEFYYLPRELQAQLRPPSPASPAQPFVPEVSTSATPPTHQLREKEKSRYAALRPTDAPQQYLPAPVEAVDDMATLLAFAQMGQLHEGQVAQLQPFLYQAGVSRLGLLLTLGVEMGLLKETGQGYRPSRTAVPWLKENREAQLRQLAEAWNQTAWNELRHVPELVCEGSGWSNEPKAGRTAVLDALTLTEEWFSIEGLCQFIKQENPDFQRPQGNYDVWYIRDRASGEYLSGFAQWEGVEGRLIRFLLQAPLSWLGLVETGEGKYRLTARGVAWLKDTAVVEHDPPIPIVVRPEGILQVPFNANRYQRFQTARIAEPFPLTPGQPYSYRLTPRSLNLAREQQITPDRVLAFLEQASGRPIPASTKRAIERWAEKGAEARLQEVVILRVADVTILETLRKHPKTRPYLGESLGDLAAVVQANSWPDLCAAAAQLGLLLDKEES